MESQSRGVLPDDGILQLKLFTSTCVSDSKALRPFNQSNLGFCAYLQSCFTCERLKPYLLRKAAMRRSVSPTQMINILGDHHSYGTKLTGTYMIIRLIITSRMTGHEATGEADDSGLVHERQLRVCRINFMCDLSLVE